MQSTDQPTKISIPFANAGTKRTIPNPSQIGITDGAASFTDGFPPKTFLPLAVGGVPPSGSDFNGVLNMVTAIQKWQSAGGLFKYDATFSAAVVGYPKGARIISSNESDVWVSTVEGNTTDPDSVGAVGWTLDTITVPDYAAVRAYVGAKKMLYVSGYMGTAAPSSIAGPMVRDDSDTTSADNGSTVFVSTNGTRWKRTIQFESGRSAPHANFNWFTSLWTVTRCHGPGGALVAEDISGVFTKTHGAAVSGAVSYVHPSGSDANAGTSWRTAFLTLAHALSSTANGTIYIWPGSYAMSDFRYTDTNGTLPKQIIAPYGGVTLRTAGDDPVAATWVLNTSTGGVWQMCMATTNKPVRVLRADLTDQFGENVPMPLLADLASLAAVNFGWAYNANYTLSTTGTTVSGSNQLSALAAVTDITTGQAIAGTGIPAGTKVVSIAGSVVTMSANATASASGVAVTFSGAMLYVRTEMSVSVQATTKNSLKIIYGDATGDMRTLLYSTISYWENITFLGYVNPLHVVGQATPEFWAKNCTFKYGNAHEMLVQGGYAYHQGCRSHRGAADSANYSSQDGITARGVEINFRTEYPGDIDTYGTSQTTNPQGTGANKNGSSNHDGYVVRVNGQHFEPFGPNIADTAGSYSWNLGVTTGHNALAYNSAPGTPRYGILNQGNNAWHDGCSAVGADAGFNSDSSANFYTFNSFGTQSATNSGTFVPYVPV